MDCAGVDSTAVSTCELAVATQIDRMKQEMVLLPEMSGVLGRRWC